MILHAIIFLVIWLVACAFGELVWFPEQVAYQMFYGAVTALLAGGVADVLTGVYQ